VDAPPKTRPVLCVVVAGHRAAKESNRRAMITPDLNPGRDWATPPLPRERDEGDWTASNGATFFVLIERNSGQHPFWRNGLLPARLTSSGCFRAPRVRGSTVSSGLMKHLPILRS
jgi:hypothetical protein